MDSAVSEDLRRILGKLGEPELVRRLTERIPGSDLNTLLLHVFREKAKQSSPGDLLKRYRQNRFVHPAEADVLELKRLELDVLGIAKKHGVSPIQLSPVAPLGCSSVVGPVDQNKAIAALRGTEVVSDATNLMALHVADLIKHGKIARTDDLRFCTTHRHVRAQHFGDAPGMLPHFHLFCMVTAGTDQGSYRFETRAFRNHIGVYREIFKSRFGSNIEIILSQRAGYPDSAGLVARIAGQGGEPELKDVALAAGTPDSDNNYYAGMQFTIKTVINGKTFFIGDGGFVDWTQKLLGNRKERLLISAIGLDRLLL